MLSELSRGKCSWDGILKLHEREGSRFERARIKSSVARKIQFRPSTSFTKKSNRTHTAVRSLPCEQSVIEDNQLLLPKTYLTRKGDLVLFAVFDDELFALVDSSLNTSTESLFPSKLKDENVELLSQFHTLEDFVLSVLDYKHEKEKSLYASAHKKLFAKQKQHVPIAKDNVTIDKRETEFIENNTAQEIPQIQLDDSIEGNYDNSTRISSPSVDELQDLNNNDKVKNSTQHYEDLSLAAAPKAATKGKLLRSSLIDRKSIQSRDNNDIPKEYIEFHTSLRQRQSSVKDITKHEIINSKYNSNQNLNQILFEKQNRGMSPPAVLDESPLSSSGVVPNSVLYLLRNIEQTHNTSKGIKSKRQAQDKTSATVLDNSTVSNNNTLMPFMFDENTARSKSYSEIVDSRRGSIVTNNERRRSASLKDLANINLHPRISSAKPTPELRALGVTPSAIKITQKDFQQILSVTKNTLSNSSNIDVSGMEKCDVYQSERADDTGVFWKEGSFFGIEEAKKRLALTTDVNNIDVNNSFRGDAVELSKWASDRTSICSMKSDNMDDEEDKILFSYIRSSFRKGSWNPKVSFSYNNENDDTSKVGSDCDSNIKREPEPRKQTQGQNRSNEHVLTSSRVQSFRDNVRNATSTSLNIENDSNILQTSNTSYLSTPSNKDKKPLSENYKRSFSHDPHENRLPNSELTSSNRLLRAFSLDNSRPMSHASSNEKLDEVLSVRSLSPFPRLPTPESDVQREKSYSFGSEHMEPLPMNGEPIAQRPLQGDSLKMSVSNNSQLQFDKVEIGNSDGARAFVRNPHSQQTISHQLVNQKVDSKNSVSRNATDESKIKITESRSKSLNQDFNRESTFASNTATNISIMNSNPDQEIVNMSDSAATTEISESGLSEVNAKAATGGLGSPAVKDIKGIRNDDRKAYTSTENNPNQNETEKQRSSKQVEKNSVLFSQSDKTTPVDSNVEIVVDDGLLNQTEVRGIINPIKNITQSSHDSVFIENDVFGSKQLLHNDNTNTVQHSDANEKIKMEVLSYEQQLILGNVKHPGIDMQYNDTVAISTNRGLTRAQNMGKRDQEDLKIDLKMTKNTNAVLSDERRPTQSKHLQKERLKPGDQDGLRLEGIGGEENKDDDSKLEELKILIERNKTNTDVSRSKKSVERSVRKKATPKPGKRRTTSSRDVNGRKSSSPASPTSNINLTKKVVTTETLTTDPIESNNIIPLEKDDSEEYKIIRESTLELEEQSQVPINVKIQNVEVKKVSKMEPEKQGAYPPSKTKKGKKAKKILKKSTNERKISEERLKYEEQMKFLKEKEIEQQKARETAMAKQKALEEEKMRYQEEEEDAKKKEEEARTRLAEAKFKAKEDREAKRLADAEKRRQLVEQRREERKKKELEIAKKEKDAERLKYERERRAEELREQRARLKEQEKLEEELILEQERQEALQREEEEKRLEEERIRKAQEELERLIEEREYREQLRRVAEAQQAKMRELEEERLLEEQREKQRIVEERERLKRAEYLKLQAELERQKEAEQIAERQRKMAGLKAASRKAELIKRRENNLERLFDLKSKRESQSISRSFTFTYFVHIPRSVWELPVGWNKRSASSRNNRPTSTSTTVRSAKQ